MLAPELEKAGPESPWRTGWSKASLSIRISVDELQSASGLPIESRSVALGYPSPMPLGYVLARAEKQRALG